MENNQALQTVETQIAPVELTVQDVVSQVNKIQEIKYPHLRPENNKQNEHPQEKQSLVKHLQRFKAAPTITIESHP